MLVGAGGCWGTVSVVREDVAGGARWPVGPFAVAAAVLVTVGLLSGCRSEPVVHDGPFAAACAMAADPSIGLATAYRFVHVALDASAAVPEQERDAAQDELLRDFLSGKVSCPSQPAAVFAPEMVAFASGLPQTPECPALPRLGSDGVVTVPVLPGAPSATWEWLARAGVAGVETDGACLSPEVLLPPPPSWEEYDAGYFARPEVASRFSALVGQSLGKVQELAEQSGYVVRVVNDGPMTMDLSYARLNLVVDDRGVVSSCGVS